MKTVFLYVALVLLTVASSSPAFAAPNSAKIKAALEAQKSCNSFVRYDDANVYLGFARYKDSLEEPRSPIPAQVRVAPIDGQPAFTIATNDGAIDMLTVGNKAYVLTYTSIEEWSLSERSRLAEYPTTTAAAPLEYKQHASAFALYNNKLIIAHGRLGLSVFDLATKKITNQIHLASSQSPLESQATGITIQGNRAYIAMDSFTLSEDPAQQSKVFKGLVVFDLDQEKVVSEMTGLDPGATDVISDGSRLIVSYGGDPVWKYNLEDFKFPVQGHPTGSPAMDDTFIYTCFSTLPPSGSGLMLRVPMALDRKAMKLD
jgi:hypothetical protein